MTSGYYRTSSPVTALPMIMRWISLVPSKIVKLVQEPPVQDRPQAETRVGAPSSDLTLRRRRLRQSL